MADRAEGRAVVTARTLAGLLKARAETHADAIALRCRVAGDEWRERSWAAYWDGARRAAAGLWARGVRPGDHLLMLVTDVESAVLTLFGAWSIGAVPIQVGLPFRLGDVAGFIAQLEDTAARLDARALVLSRALAPFAPTSASLPVHVAEEVVESEPAEGLPHPDEFAADTALIQLTSGSTGSPRGVVLTHERLLRHLHCMSRVLPSRADSVAVSWLPLHHDMGLIGGLLFPFYNGFTANMMSPLDFRGRPLVWLEAMAKFRATICAAPPSAYAMLLRLAPRAIAAGYDLSAWECAMIGAEPIAPELLCRFADAFAPANFRAEAFFPVYGLAEATVAVSFPRLLAPARVVRIDRLALERDGVAAPSDEPHALELVGVGRPIPETKVRVVDAAGTPLPDRHVGEIRVCASTLMRGYYKDPAATEDALAEGWLRTGDLGFVDRGELFITGRLKDIIIRGGLNLIPTVIEDIAGAVDGVRPGGVAAVGVREPELETEVVYLVVETRLEGQDQKDLRERLDAALQLRGVTVDRIALVAPGALPKTTSGKLRRREIAAALGRGEAL
ncbi:AMP-binding protein [Nannocystis radixulma]|uniref:AMP-binding protein n=1 Tax=Nannocystis radixulma TaxID=2995305 RepID=A0ABT5BGR6_9BACT|nr:AMP-binding protein [Nannocystis radixulma]MDC0672820.1 AMP-binding protein [Nannocystis radixulma]